MRPAIPSASLDASLEMTPQWQPMIRHLPVLSTVWPLFELIKSELRLSVMLLLELYQMPTIRSKKEFLAAEDQRVSRDYGATRSARYYRVTC